jgi:3-deoxy-manno-octulosonate cytidylyltransferase (CMP-KDO synthetase)
MSFRIVIPARMASERLPGKPLLELAGLTLIEHVFLRARDAGAEAVVIATDSEEIRAAAETFGAQCVMTSATHRSGSDRIAECADRMGWADDALIVNLQGDEPLMPAECLRQVAGLLEADPAADVSSLFWPIESNEEASDPNVVKVVTGCDGAALYFSRSPIPHLRGGAPHDTAGWKRHIGLYAYRAGALRAFTRLDPTPLEQLERLEQLRFLENGRRIAMDLACRAIPAGVDTPADLERVRRLLASTD